MELIIRVEEVGDNLNRFHPGDQNLDICSPDRPIDMTGDPAREQDFVQNFATTLADERVVDPRSLEAAILLRNDDAWRCRPRDEVDAGARDGHEILVATGSDHAHIERVRKGRCASSRRHSPTVRHAELLNHPESLECRQIVVVTQIIEPGGILDHGGFGHERRLFLVLVEGLETIELFLRFGCVVSKSQVFLQVHQDLSEQTVVQQAIEMVKDLFLIVGSLDRMNFWPLFKPNIG